VLEYKEISIYFDINKKLIGVPCGKASQFGEDGVASLDIFFELTHSYTDDELEEFIGKVFDACYSKEYFKNEMTAIEKYTKKKGYATAVKGYQCMVIRFYQGEYTFVPMKIDRKYKGAFEGIKGISMKVSLYNKYIPVETGALAIAFRKTMEVIMEQE